MAVAVCLVLFAAATRGRAFGLTVGLDLWGCLPAWNLPDGAGEGLQSERALGPLAARSARAIESAEACVDGSLVRFRSALWCCLADCAIGGSILTIGEVSDRSMKVYGQIDSFEYRSTAFRGKVEVTAVRSHGDGWLWK